MPDRDLIAEGRKLLKQARELPLREGMFETIQTAARSLADDLIIEPGRARAHIAELEADQDGYAETARQATALGIDQAARIAELEQQPARRVIETAAVSNEPTGTVIRHQHGDIGSVDHGPTGEWLGGDTRVHFLDFQHAQWMTVADMLADPEPSDRWTVLWQPEVDRG
ncbi:hypothetical protein ACIP5Y_21190 [Nocardia sp. NPDC088792]|uniref:hypothetical protein n=1 Tax=Nocardia sp. NPDC088792 TaxID=3364332 RepID=UPI0038061541